MSDLRALRLAAIDAALDHFGQKLDDFCPPGEVLAADSDWAGDVRADAWEEHKHPRDPDGKFASGGGSATFKSYAESAKVDPKTGKPKLQASGFIKHMLMQGTMTVDEIFAELQKEFEYPNNQKPHVKYYWKELKKKGVDVPEIGSKKELEEATQEILEETGVKAEQPPKEEDEEEVTLVAGVDYFEPQHQDTVETLQFFVKYAGETQKKLAAALAEQETEYPGTINSAVYDLKDAVNQDHGPKKVADILAIKPIVSESGDAAMAKDPGVQAFNALLGAVQEAWKKDAQAPKAEPEDELANFQLTPGKPSTAVKTINPHKELYSQKTKNKIDAFYAKMLTHKNDDEVKEADAYLDKLFALSSQGDHKKAYTEVGALEHFGLPDAFMADAGNLTYDVYKDLLKKVDPKYHADLYPSEQVDEPESYQPVEAAKPPPPPPKAAKGELVGTSTKEFHDQLKSYWPSTLPENLTAVKEQDEKIEVALSLDTVEEQKAALAAIEPFGEGSLGMAKKAMDSYLAKVKVDYGVSAEQSGPAKGKTKAAAEPTPKQTVAAKAITALAPRRSNTESWHVDADGKEVRAVLKINTKEIAHDGYAKVTAAYNGSPDNSLSHHVDSAMSAYAAPVWETFTGPQHSAISSYKGSGYTAINNAMLAGTVDKNPEIKKKVNAISAAMKTSRLPADTPVYRGVRCDLKTFTGFDNPEDCIGKCFEHKNFASVSRRLETSQKFGTKVMMKMTLPAGMPAIVLAGGDQSGGEREIILDAKSIFRIDKVEKTHYQDESYMLHVVYLGRREDE